MTFGLPNILFTNLAIVIKDDALTPNASDEIADNGASIFSLIVLALSSTLFVFEIVFRTSFKIRKYLYT